MPSVLGLSLRYRIVDVFTDRPLAGNALCVVLDPCPIEAMQALARETNLSETTFPTLTDGATYDNRIFTPGVELPFAGHPTIGTAFVAYAGGVRHIIVGVDPGVDLADCSPDLASVSELCRAQGSTTCAVVRAVGDDRLAVRVFVPAAGVAEDPGTGSVAGPIGVLARERWGTAVDLVIEQGVEMGRPSRIDVHAERGALRVGGAVTPVAEGTFTL